MILVTQEQLQSVGSDLPVEQPTKFELITNLTAAKTLGVAIPASFLSLADELVE